MDQSSSKQTLPTMNVALLITLLTTLASCSNLNLAQFNKSSPSGPDTPKEDIEITPDLTPNQRVKAAITLVEIGDYNHAEAELQQAIQDSNNRKTSNRAIHILNQLAITPLDYFSQDYGQSACHYQVKENDSLSTIAAAFLNDRMQFPALARYNNIKVPRDLRPGDQIKIPSKSAHINSEGLCIGQSSPTKRPQPNLQTATTIVMPTEPNLRDDLINSITSHYEHGNYKTALNMIADNEALLTEDLKIKQQMEQIQFKSLLAMAKEQTDLSPTTAVIHLTDAKRLITTDNFFQRPQNQTLLVSLKETQAIIGKTLYQKGINLLESQDHHLYPQAAENLKLVFQADPSQTYFPQKQLNQYINTMVDTLLVKGKAALNNSGEPELAVSLLEAASRIQPNNPSIEGQLIRAKAVIEQLNNS